MAEIMLLRLKQISVLFLFIGINDKLSVYHGHRGEIATKVNYEALILRA